MVKILQRTQHDLMNNLQIIQGYLSMDKIDVGKTKLAECIGYYQEERKLMNINASHFILWVIEFNHCHENIQLSYQISDENLNLWKFDNQLIEDSEYVVKMIERLGSKMKLYNMKLLLYKSSDSVVRLSFTIVDQFDWINDFRKDEQNKRICVKESNEGMICEISYTIE